MSDPFRRATEDEFATVHDFPLIDGDEPSTWTPVDLAEAFDGEDIPPPTVLARTDGACLLYVGRTHSFQGEPESCKTWAALLAVAQELAAGRKGLWIDYEDDARGVVSRLKALGATRQAVIERFTYIRPEEPLLDSKGRATDGNVILGQLLETHDYAIAVIDGVTEAMVTEGLNLIDNADVGLFARRLPKRIARATGATVVQLDHLTKDREGQGRYAIGGQHKLAGLTGAAYKFEVIRPLTRAEIDPVEGSVLVTVTKDRPGYVRSRAKEGRVGTLDITAWPDGTVSALIAPVIGEPAPELSLVVAIAQYLTQYDGASQTKIEENVAGKAALIRSAIRWMLAPERGWVRVEKSGQSHRHHLTETGRTELGL